MAADVFLRGKKYWCWTKDPATGLRVRKSTDCTDKAAARLVKARWERESADPEAHAAANQAATTIADAVDALVARKRREGKADATLRIYREKAGHIMRVFGAKARLSVITAPSVDGYIAKREAEGAAPHTIHKELGTMRGMLKTAKRTGGFRGDLSAVMPASYSAKYVPRKLFLTMPQVNALLNNLSQFRGAHVAYVIATGARLSESHRARASDVDGAFVRLHGNKTLRSARTNPAILMYKNLLDKALDVLRMSNGFAPWQNSRRDIHLACKAAKVPLVTWNDLRRTFASLLKQAGVSNDVLADLLGHADTTMVRRVYGHDTPESLKATLERQLGAGKGGES